MALDEKYQAIRLDRSRHFGVVCPPDNGAHFSQDGFLFGADDALAEDWLTEENRKKLDKLIARREADAAAEKARREVLEKAGLSGDEGGQDAGGGKQQQAGGAQQDGDVVDLKGWAKGEVQYPWFTVRKAAMDQYHRDVDNSAALVEFLIEQGVITAEQAVRGK